MSSLEEFATEMKSTRKEIANQAAHHILPTDTVLTYQFNESSTLNVSEIFSYFKEFCYWNIKNLFVIIRHYDFHLFL